jgi:hypothetical protein
LDRLVAAHWSNLFNESDAILTSPEVIDGGIIRSVPHLYTIGQAPPEKTVPKTKQPRSGRGWLFMEWSKKKIAPILEGGSLLHHPLIQKEPPEND